MFDIGWTELMVIGIVALIVIGPKDLPEMFRTLGRFTAKAKGMAREFSRAMESAADEAGVKDVAKDLRNVTSAKSMGLDALKEATSKFEAWDPMKSSNVKTPKPDPSAPKVEAPKAEAPKVEVPKVDAAKAEVPKGPATQALADAQAAKRAARAAAAVAEKPAPAAKPAPKPKPKAAPKPKAPVSAAEPSKAKKPRSKKSDA